MLPFLKKNKDQSASGIIIKSRQPDEPDNDSGADEPEYGQEDCAKDMMHALNTNDHEMFAAALGEFIDNHGKQPDSNESSPSPHTYDAQNQLAAQGQE
jgi:hypothetical protein